MGYPPIRSTGSWREARCSKIGQREAIGVCVCSNSSQQGFTGALAETYSTYLGGGQLDMVDCLLVWQLRCLHTGQRTAISSSEPQPLSVVGLTSLSESLAMQAKTFLHISVAFGAFDSCPIAFGKGKGFFCNVCSKFQSTIPLLIAFRQQEVGCIKMVTLRVRHCNTRIFLQERNTALK